jgi:hypothetical protein
MKLGGMRMYNPLKTKESGISFRYDEKNGKVIMTTKGRGKISYYASSLVSSTPCTPKDPVRKPKKARTVKGQ